MLLMMDSFPSNPAPTPLPEGPIQKRTHSLHIQHSGQKTARTETINKKGWLLGASNCSSSPEVGEQREEHGGDMGKPASISYPSLPISFIIQPGHSLLLPCYTHYRRTGKSLIISNKIQKDSQVQILYCIHKVISPLNQAVSL